MNVLKCTNPMTMIFSQTMNDDETYKSISSLVLLLLYTMYTLWLTFAAGAPDVDLFASVDVRLLSLSEFSKENKIKVLLSLACSTQ